MKHRYDYTVKPCRFEKGSGVWLHNPKKKKGQSLKLARHWEGPYVVVKHINDAVVRIQKSSRSKPKVVHVNRLKAYNGPQTFEWWSEKNQEVPIVESTADPKGIPTSEKASCTQMELLRRSTRTRKPPVRFSQSGTDKS